MDTATRETSIASLAVPFNIGGTLKSPSFTPDPVGTALGAAKVVGMFVAPPLALSSLIAEKSVSDGGENACVAALEAAASGQAQEQKSTLDTVTEDPEKALEDVGKTLEGVGEGLKNLGGPRRRPRGRLWGAARRARHPHPGQGGARAAQRRARRGRGRGVGGPGRAHRARDHAAHEPGLHGYRPGRA
jgi:hypothetical protein